MRRILPLMLALGALCSGCQWLAPHQLWKLNRQPAVGGDDGYFSIPAPPVPAEVSAPASDKDHTR